MLSGGEGVRLHFGIIIFERLGHLLTDVGEVLHELGLEIGEQREHILIDQNLAIAARSCTDADGGDGDGLGDPARQVGRDAFEHHRERASLFDALGIF